MISNIKDLCSYVGASNKKRLSRTIYNNTKCGGQVNMIKQGAKTVGIVFHSIVEGSDAEFLGTRLIFPFTEDAVKEQIESMEAFCQDHHKDRYNTQNVKDKA